MTEFAGSSPSAVLSDEDDSSHSSSSSSQSQQPGKQSQQDTDGEPEGEGGGGGGGHGLTAAQKEVLERCLHALTNAKNDSHTLAALLLITRLCPANQLDQPTLRRIFEAVGLSLPARLLVTAVKGSESSQLPPEELLSLGTALLAALSTEPDMASNPQLLSTVPLLLGIISDGPTWKQQKQGDESSHAMKTHENAAHSGQSQNIEVQSADVSTTTNGKAEPVLEREDSEGCNVEENVASADQTSLPSSKLDEALAADCYQVLTAVCTLPRGPDQLLNRGAIPALCQALEQKQTLSQERGVALLGSLLSGKTRYKVWCKHPSEMLALLGRVSKEFCQAKDQDRMDMCGRLLQFLPPPGGVTTASGTDELKQVVSSLWVVLRPMMQARLTPKHIGSVLVLSACLLDLCGWELAGPPKFCCLLVNRACVEVRMGLEEPPGNELSPELQHTLTGCYRIMEAAMEQACTPVAIKPPPHTAISGLNLQQSRQVLLVLEEAFSAVIYHLQQVDPSCYGDPFIFATFRCLCSWLAEETSCLKEEVTALLPFLVGYASSHMRGENAEQHLSSWMSEMSVSDEDGPWTGRDALRYLLPALCHLSAEEGPRKVLLTLDTPALLVDFLSQGWSCLKEKGGRDPSMETTCSALLNFTVTEPERVRKDACFKTLELLLEESLPVLVHKSRLLVLAANICTLGLMIGRLKPAPSAPVEPGQRRFFSVVLRFLHGALDSRSSPGQVTVSAGWEEWWEDAGELWRLGLQALGGCVRAQPWIAVLVKEEGWLKNTLAMLEICSALPDPHTQAALEEALCAMAEQCPLCKQEIKVSMAKHDKAALSCMGKLRRSLGLK